MTDENQLSLDEVKKLRNLIDVEEIKNLHNRIKELEKK